MPNPDGFRPVGQNQTVSSRQEYLIVVPDAEREPEIAACDEVLEVLGPELRRASVDAFSDYRELDPSVAAAFDELRKRADNPKNAMAVPLDLSDRAQIAILRQVAAWTIHAEVFGAEGELATFHDCGSVITAFLTAKETGALADRLRRFDDVQIVTLEEWRRRKKAARRLRLAGFLRRRQ